jgi:hypothetical protein
MSGARLLLLTVRRKRCVKGAVLYQPVRRKRASFEQMVESKWVGFTPPRSEETSEQSLRICEAAELRPFSP